MTTKPQILNEIKTAENLQMFLSDSVAGLAEINSQNVTKEQQTVEFCFDSESSFEFAFLRSDKLLAVWNVGKQRLKAGEKFILDFPLNGIVQI